ncbi:alpha/beta hydrolase [Algoriphagus namhaensis]|uniref:Alpha/beta hydrolase n=1 Tax=Algoriphagus namhaensis TaxID=915353 RepID=A0ABV8AUM3_9BACT
MKYAILLILAYSSIALCSAQKLRNEFTYAPSTEFGEQIVFQNTKDTTVNRYEKAVINGFDSKVPFYHYINSENTNKFVLLLHGLGGSKENWVKPTSDGKLVDSLVSLGYNVIIPDAKYHGERSYEFNFRPAGTLPPELSRSQQDAESLCELYSSTIKDLRILMDYLENRYTGEKLQFDLIGYSMGGAFSLLLNAVDPRINSVASCVPPLNRPIKEIKGFAWPNEIAEKLKDISSMYYADVQRSPVILLMGRTDYFTTVTEVNQFFDGMHITDKKLKFYEAGHSLPPVYINDVIEWITSHNKN